ncbi:tRNA (adenosine(37)-N6)-dimethylallyltransferase MiaA [Hyphomicrobium sp. LHD-15]|uniref:tRNA (adenosine(37)-N6)-dimethylallyltransferase MiaA n=1 Tax=Hyphomicrobium sp. LHD-15 TaxID=3072142 RepID=UPI00280F828E|nr:tRNA (adenosine(37)-N6)-dimethylallyltransferase MiaA [Hyphomicrobium sp. LHD-15]MDQ8697470.1 tRNA (adenosine(37)-N6)-dimethylallyltransferase MiaA [Hyphomicrobium sp. LHD-15]
MTNTAAILIAGPTASGKSAFALRLAEAVGGTIINADAMQVYRELRVLTARPSVSDESRVPHRLYGHVPGREAYSAARYAAEAAQAIGETQREGRVPIVVGGTGLYFKALTEGLSPIPQIPPDIRMRWRQAAVEQGAAVLHAVLQERDPVMAARLRPTDPQRIVRALEVQEATGRSLAEWQEIPGEPFVRVEESRAFVVAPSREEMRARIDARFDDMLAQGALDEVRALMQLEIGDDLPVMRALGVKPLRDLLGGGTGLEEAAERSKAETRQYAKRQVTWLKSNMISWRWINTQETKSFEREICDFINSKA